MAKIFIDTNILAYAFDNNNAKKRDKCRILLKNLEEGGQFVVSTQILQEFYVVATQELGAQPLTAKQTIKTLENFEIVVVDPSLIGDAIDCHLLNRISFWDALVIVSAEKAKCEKVWTEDLNNGQTINGVFIENPMTLK